MPANDRQVGGDHYQSKSIQPWDAIKAWMPLNEFRAGLRFNAIKYLARMGSKGGEQDALRDLEKAIHYLQKLLETYDEIQ